jgi:RNA polymerase sigma factor (sigma-70 family)
MNGLTDQQLLSEYARHRSEPAFAELVRRHVDCVYSAAVRMVRDAHLAKDVTQGVFVALAQNARPLADRTVLSGWLHRTAQNLAANTVRSDVRRRAREQEAAAMNEMLAADPDVSWENIAPLLDTALGELGESDRDALMLRYFEKKSAQEMAGVLGISDEAAQKRVSRAVEKLRGIFAKRKMAVGAGTLTILISANAVQSAPAGLAATISAAAVLAGTAATTSTVITATKAITMTTIQKTVITAALAAAVGTGIFEAHQAAQLREQTQVLQQQQASLTEQIRQLQQEQDDATNQLTALLAENEQLKSNSNENELLKLRGEVGVLRAQLASAKSAATRPDLTAIPSSNDGSNQAMLDYLGNPAPLPPNLNAAYSKEGLINALQNAAQAANIVLKRIEIDDSEFPYLVGVEIQTGNDMQKLQDQIKTMGEYNYSGGTSDHARFVGNIIPYDQYPAGEKRDILNRLGLRETMFYDKFSGVLPSKMPSAN